MKSLTYIVLCITLFGCRMEEDNSKTMKAHVETEKPDYVIVIHGGAGSRTPGNDTQDQEFIRALSFVLNRGDSLLASGASAIDVVEHCIRLLEDDSLFNAGKGSVFAADGTNRLDASIMDGSTLNAGAVAGLTRVRNPISAARAVLDSSDHVLLSGNEAEEFAGEQGLDLVDPSYFFTQKSFDTYKKAQAQEISGDEKHGTVGCVVLDKKGHLAAGTSTGGMTNKKYGRIGDSPIIGAGTYAEDGVCAVSATGHGEYFIRYVVAHDIAARMKYEGLTVDSSAHFVIMDLLKNAGGSGGVICVDHQGNITMPFNTSAMFRGYQQSGTKAMVKIYQDQ